MVGLAGSEPGEDGVFVSSRVTNRPGSWVWSVTDHQLIHHYHRP